MQADELDIVSALTYQLRTVKEIDKLKILYLSGKFILQLLKKVVHEDGKYLYQGQELKRYCEAKLYYENNYIELCQFVVNNLQTR